MTEETIKVDKEQADNAPLIQKIPPKKLAKDVLSLELTRPVLTRVKNRLKELKKIGSAHHEKQMKGHKVIWHTTRPKVHMTPPEAKMENGVGIISYTTFKTDKKGDKLMETTKAPDPRNPDREIDVQASYVEDVTIIETIVKYKPLKTEEMK